MWVRLKSVQHIERNGHLVTYHAGDWIDVGKQTALLWLSRGDAEIPSYQRDSLHAGEAGVVINAPMVTPFEQQFGLTKLAITLIVGEPYLAFNKTMCWNPAVPLRPELIGAGFAFLETWEMAAPLYSYDELAIHMGTDDDRAVTKDVIHDLRVPVVDTRLLFVRTCENTTRLFTLWSSERERGSDIRLAFMRAWYQVKPLALYLPVTWHSPRAFADVV
jgi:hypothetical protein